MEEQRDVSRDRLHQAERSDLPVVFGLTHPRRNNRPFVIAYEEFWNTFHDALRSGRIEYLVRPPGWAPVKAKS